MKIWPVVLMAGLSLGAVADTIKTTPTEVTEDIQQTKKDFNKTASILKKLNGTDQRFFNKEDLQNVERIRSKFETCIEDDKQKCSLLKKELNDRSRSRRSRDPRIKSLIGIADVVEEIGVTLEEYEKKPNLIQTYTDIFKNLSPAQRRGLPLPNTLLRMPVKNLQGLFEKRIYPLLGAINEGLSTGRRRANNNQLKSSWPSKSCDLAIGAKHKDSNTTDNADRCEYDELQEDGLLRNHNFSLRPYLPCVKDQRNRGTCSAFATVGALEVKMFKNRSQEYNLSEQMTYLYNEIYGDFLGRYTYGLNTMKAIKKLKKKGAKIPLEKYWVYNPSRYMDDYNSSNKKYPQSCKNYTGQKCTNRSFQTNEKKDGWFSYVYPTPSIGKPYVKIRERNSFMNMFNAKGSLELAINYLNNGEPVVVSFGVRPVFSNEGGGTNYIKYKKQDNDGGHAANLVGFVYNKNLPEGAPKASEKGYFILKNSWGKGFGDCGYVYVDFKYMRKYAYGLATIKYSYID